MDVLTAGGKEFFWCCKCKRGACRDPWGALPLGWYEEDDQVYCPDEKEVPISA